MPSRILIIFDWLSAGLLYYQMVYEQLTLQYITTSTIIGFIALLIEFRIEVAAGFKKLFSRNEENKLAIQENTQRSKSNEVKLESYAKEIHDLKQNLTSEPKNTAQLNVSPKNSTLPWLQGIADIESYELTIEEFIRELRCFSSYNYVEGNVSHPITIQYRAFCCESMPNRMLSDFVNERLFHWFQKLVVQWQDNHAVSIKILLHKHGQLNWVHHIEKLYGASLPKNVEVRYLNYRKDEGEYGSLVISAQGGAVYYNNIGALSGVLQPILRVVEPTLVSAERTNFLARFRNAKPYKGFVPPTSGAAKAV